jgi:hypothetical protein
MRPAYREETKDGVTTLVVKHNNWPSLRSFAISEHNSKGASDSSPAEWSHTDTWDDAVLLGNSGWQDGAKLCEQKGEALFGDMGHLAYRWKRYYTNEGGGRFDVGRVASGEPEHWIKRKKKVVRGLSSKIVNIVVNCAYGSGLEANSVVARGATIAAIVNLLQLAGLNVQVMGYFGSADDPVSPKYRVEQYFVIKDAQYTIDMAHIAMALAHPSTWRRFGLASLEALPSDEWKHHIGVPGLYGFTCEASHQGDIYIPAPSNEEWWNIPALAREYVIRMLKSQGLEELLLESDLVSKEDIANA